MILLICTIVLFVCALILEVMDFVYFLSFDKSIFSVIQEIFLDDESD